MGFFKKLKRAVKWTGEAVDKGVMHGDYQDLAALGLAVPTGGASLLFAEGGLLDPAQLKTPKIPDPGAPPVPVDYSDQAIRDIQQMQRLASRGRLGLRSTFLTGSRGAYAPPAIPRRMTGV
jgi:hypothetical protein